ncbi:MAG: MATE family efflux transporter [Kiritimatiellae bacterium]|nr:MATE family efflux transporter [Kiritimatiellia bacterium]
MAAMATMARDFTKGPIFGPLARFSIPFMLSNALQVLYAAADMYIVGHFTGAAGLASVVNASRAFVFLTMLSIGLSMSGQIYVAQLIGQGRRADLNVAIGTFFGTLLASGAVLSAIGLAGARRLLLALNVPREAFGGALDYLMICSAGLVFSFGYNMVSAVLRGMGDSKRPFIFVAMASVANIVLDLVAVAWLGWGPAGAALATILGQAISFIFAWCHLRRRRAEFGFDFQPRSFIPNRAVFAAQMRLGIPFAVRFAAINVSMMYVIRLVNGLGMAASTVFGVGVQMDDIVTKVTQGIMQGATAMVGQNYGARRFDRVRAVVLGAWLLSVGFYVVYGALLLLRTEQMFGIFTKDAAVLSLAPVFARNIIWQFPGLVLMRGTNGFINGIGNARLSLVFGIFDGVVLRIGCSWLLGSAMGMGLAGYVLGYAVACYGMGVPSLAYFLWGRWEERGAVTS